MKNFINLFLLLVLSGCFGSEKEQKLVLDCNIVEIGPDRFNQEFKKRIQFIWYSSNNSLQGEELNYVSVTPFQKENDFEITFERNKNNQGPGDTLRMIVFNKITNELNITHPKEINSPDRKYTCVQKR
tara:strand:+ start:418 stop:801 length:384 start_codon:yes stop_codon:yes gene_type:complete